MITCTLTPREYQQEAVDKCLSLFESGIKGALIRSFTGSGKTPMACMLAERWLNSGLNRKVMVISYERQLVWQFQAEIEDFLGVTPGIEMGTERINPNEIPDIVVCSRQSLLRRKPKLEQELESPEALDGKLSRLYKFNHEHDWLVIFDEAHKHAYHLRSIKHIVDWFDMNTTSRRVGLTATPRRSDNVSIGEKMFPGVAIDFPLRSLEGRDAVQEGYAVPYRIKYINVQNVDFSSVEKIGKDFNPEQLGALLDTEANLAKLCEPLLDLVENRRTLIFSPTVKMAEDVQDYINARVPVSCPTCKTSWKPRHLIGDGAACDCGRMYEPEDVQEESPAARCIHGETPVQMRQEVYRAHRTGKIQFLSVCGLCSEGYSDCDISCVAIFRPVSKAAVSRAEQMMGRGARPQKGIIEGLSTVEERLEAIKASEWPDCMIVDLVGASGLQDCASAVQVYADGLPDEVIELAEQKMLEGEEDVSKAIEEATEEVETEKERQRQAIAAKRKAAEEAALRRAKANASVEYTAHDTGHWDRPQGSTVPNAATKPQLDYIANLGLDMDGYPISKKQAGRIITQFKEGASVDEVKHTNRLPKELGPPNTPATIGQLKWLNWQNIPAYEGITKYEASQLISKAKGKSVDGKAGETYRESMPSKDYWDLVTAIGDSASGDELTAIARIAKKNQDKMDTRQWANIVEAGKVRRRQLSKGV